MTYSLTQAVTRVSRFRAALWAMLLICVSSTVLTAQAMSCETARQTILSNGSKRDALIEASSVIVRCEDLAPNTIVAAIRKATPGSLRDTLALGNAHTLRDARLADSIAVLAKDPQQSLARRTFFVGLLVRYINPHAGLNASTVNHAVPAVLVYLPHTGVIDGNQRMLDYHRERIRSQILSVSYHDSDANLRKLAGLAAEQVTLLPQ
jgi:hypothetical protein